MMQRAALSMAVAVLLTISAPAQEKRVCASYSECNKLGLAAMRTKQFDRAIASYEEQASIAELAEIEAYQVDSPEAKRRARVQLVTAWNNLTVALAAKKELHKARAMAFASLKRDENVGAQSNLRRLETQLSDWKWPKSPVGEYVHYAGRGTWNSVIIESVKGDTAKFCFDGQWWGAGQDRWTTGPSGLGDLSGTVKLNNNAAYYQSTEFGECKITMELQPDQLKAAQQGDSFACGFGHNVTLDGTFYRISTKSTCAKAD